MNVSSLEGTSKINKQMTVCIYKFITYFLPFTSNDTNKQQQQPKINNNNKKEFNNRKSSHYSTFYQADPPSTL